MREIAKASHCLCCSLTHKHRMFIEFIDPVAQVCSCSCCHTTAKQPDILAAGRSWATPCHKTRSLGRRKAAASRLGTAVQEVQLAGLGARSQETTGQRRGRRWRGEAGVALRRQQMKTSRQPRSCAGSERKTYLTKARSRRGQGAMGLRARRFAGGAPDTDRRLCLWLPRRPEAWDVIRPWNNDMATYKCDGACSPHPCEMNTRFWKQPSIYG